MGIGTQRLQYNNSIGRIFEQGDVLFYVLPYVIKCSLENNHTLVTTKSEFEKEVVTTWWQHEDNITTTWRQRDDNVTTTWRQREKREIERLRDKHTNIHCYRNIRNIISGNGSGSDNSFCHRTTCSTCSHNNMFWNITCHNSSYKRINSTRNCNSMDGM